MITMPQLNPTITFMMPIQNKQDLIIEQINTIFRFSEHYGGFCEILIVAGEVDALRLKLAWLAMKLNKISHPQVRTRMICYTSKSGLPSLIETGINQALGQRIIIIASTPEIVESAEINDVWQREILLVRYALDVNALQENLA
jgi:hypothetical protein